MHLTTRLAVTLASILLAFSVPYAETVPLKQANSPDAVLADSAASYYVEISISRNLLTLYEKKGAGELTYIAEHRVGTAVRGLATYPLGLGTATAIYRIHGNNDPRRVGRRVTGGCFVMDNTDGLALARKIRVGTEVNILP